MCNILPQKVKLAASGTFIRLSRDNPSIIAGIASCAMCSTNESWPTATIAAAIFAARALTDWDGKRSPRLVAAVANSVEKAEFLVWMLEAKG
jgi:hypothetical protein